MPQMIRRLPFRVLNRRHQFRFQPDAALATLDRFSCDTRAAAQVMCPKKRGWMAERVGFFSWQVDIFFNLGQIECNYMTVRTFAIVY